MIAGTALYVVAKIEGRPRIAIAQNHLQAVGLRLLASVVHGDDRPEKPCARPTIKREGKFLARASREQIQLEALRPLYNLPRSHQNLLVANVSRLPIVAPVKPFESRSEERRVG